jgi:quercetin dioxygenase-like cupin family protein
MLDNSAILGLQFLSGNSRRRGRKGADIMTKTARWAVLAALCLPYMLGLAFAHGGPAVVPDREREIARDIAAAGPTENRGVESVNQLGAILIDGEFPGVEGKELRAREIVIAPGGVIAVHQHDARPGLAYILEGEIIEHRNDADGPIMRRAGDISFEKSGIVHWWENVSGATVRALVVDIVDAPAQ